jgi:hypothetical protein
VICNCDNQDVNDDGLFIPPHVCTDRKMLPLVKTIRKVGISLTRHRDIHVTKIPPSLVVIELLIG